MNTAPSILEEEALLALRRTLWQLAATGLVAACAIEHFMPDAGAMALWCGLVPLSALVVHFRNELARPWHGHGRDDNERARARRGARPRALGRHRSTMAIRQVRPSRLAGAR